LDASLPRHGAARALPLVVNGVSCGSVTVSRLRARGGDWYTKASDVAEVQDEDLATPGSLRGDRARYHVQVADPFRGKKKGYVLLGPLLRKPQDCSKSPISV